MKQAGKHNSNSERGKSAGGGCCTGGSGSAKSVGGAGYGGGVPTVAEEVEHGVAGSPTGGLVQSPERVDGVASERAWLLPHQNEPALDAEEFALMCKALGHPARVRIVEYLSDVDRCVCGRIVEVMPLAQSTVSQHLKILKECGLVRGEVEGPRTCYCIDRLRLERFRAMAAVAFTKQDEEQ